jgi:hypothetical protein
VGLDYSELGIRKRLLDHSYIVHNFADAMSRLVREGSSAGAIEVTLDEAHNHMHGRSTARSRGRNSAFPPAQPRVSLPPSDLVLGG